MLVSAALTDQLQAADALQQLSPLHHPPPTRCVSGPALVHTLWQVSLAVASCGLPRQPRLCKEVESALRQVVGELF